MQEKMKLPVENAVELLKALADPTRLGIVDFLLNGERPPSDIQDALEKSQSTISQHLKILVHQNILEVRRDGPKKYYKVEDSITPILNSISNFLTARSKQELERAADRTRIDTLL
ncbi:MAG: ArsR/SmtB family transcription factor [Candidatus Hodarchaeota archaeon]